jgi:hypothetical protein
VLKRYQVLFTDWLAEHIKFIADKYDISFSEAVRIALCLQVTKLVSTAYPKYKIRDIDKEFVGVIKKKKLNKVKQEQFHKMLSKIYFEARKATEFWKEEQKKQK